MILVIFILLNEEFYYSLLGTGKFSYSYENSVFITFFYIFSVFSSFFYYFSIYFKINLHKKFTFSCLCLFFLLILSFFFSFFFHFFKKNILFIFISKIKFLKIFICSINPRRYFFQKKSTL